VLLAIALASLAVRPQLFFGGPPVGYDCGLQHTLLLLALAVNALRHGVRRSINWPLGALTAAFALGLAAGDLHPKRTFPLLAMSLAVLALPWCFTSVVLSRAAGASLRW
jgi:hypothetical protein